MIEEDEDTCRFFKHNIYCILKNEIRDNNGAIESVNEMNTWE